MGAFRAIAMFAVFFVAAAMTGCVQSPALDKSKDRLTKNLHDIRAASQGSPPVVVPPGMKGWFMLQPFGRPPTGASFQAGAPLALSGDYLLASVRRDGRAGKDTGAAYAFQRDPAGGWDRGFEFPNPNPTPGCEFHGKALHGDTALLGAGGGPFCSHPRTAYIFRRVGPGNRWQKTQEFRSPDNDEAGRQVFAISGAVHGDLLAVGQTWRMELSKNKTPFDGGPVYVSMRAGDGRWGPLQKIVPAEGFQFGETFGTTVALSSTDLLVGAGSGGFDRTKKAAVYVFRRVPGTAKFVQTQRVPPPDLPAESEFGVALAIAGNVAVIGAPGYYFHRGRAYVMERPSADAPWGPLQLLLPPPEEAPRGMAECQIGQAVATDAKRILVGGPGCQSAWLISRDAQGRWTQREAVAVPKREHYKTFGAGVAIDGEYVAVGDTTSDLHAPKGGAIYINK